MLQARCFSSACSAEMSNVWNTAKFALCLCSVTLLGRRGNGWFPEVPSDLNHSVIVYQVSVLTKETILPSCFLLCLALCRHKAPVVPWPHLGCAQLTQTQKPAWTQPQIVQPQHTCTCTCTKQAKPVYLRTTRAILVTYSIRACL